MKHFYASLLFLAANSCLFAQVPVLSPIMGPSAVCSSPAAPTNFSVTATNSPFSYGWAVMPSNGVVIGTPGIITDISFPNTNSTYTVFCTAVNASGSSNTSTLEVTVMEMPTVTFSGSNLTFCQGSSTNLVANSTILYSASSSLSYTWNPSAGLNTTSGYSVVASPTIDTQYSVDVALGACINTYQVSVSVLKPPTILVTANPSTICAGSGNTSTIVILGDADLYQINFLPVTTTVFSPGVTTTYTVSGSASNGCTVFATATVNVDACVGINEMSPPAFEKLNVYPNPNNGTFILRSSRDEKVNIRNDIGQVVRQINLAAGAETEIRELPPGIYFIIGTASVQKLVVTR